MTRTMVWAVAAAIGLLTGCLGRSDLEEEDASGGAAGAAGSGSGGVGGAAGSGASGGSVSGGSAGVGAGGQAGSAGGGAAGQAGFGGAGGSPACAPDTCDGCCDPATGLCLAGDEITACGSKGALCADCAELGFDCQAGSCAGQPPECSTLSCSGCCDSAGVCRGGGTSDACGAGGVACANCAATGEGCTAGKCQGPPPACSPTNCDGCCDAAGACRSGTSDGQCGSDGEQCQDCAGSGLQCSVPGGYCAFVPSCSSATCPNGCCDAAGGCRDGRRDQACGSSGGTCSDCTSSGQACAPQGFCYNGTHCGPDNCAGCCTANGQCRPGSGNQACGQFGGLCENCANSAKTCQGQVCTDGSTCPAAYPGCSPNAATSPAFRSDACTADDLSQLATQCSQGSCGPAFGLLLNRNPACYDCMLQFTGDDAYARCLAPFLSASCNHNLTCAAQCDAAACGQCGATDEDACGNQVFGSGGDCEDYLIGLYCNQAALGGPAAFCQFNGDVGDWLLGVGNYFCAQ
ncbi:MAG: hypothetical protein R3B89_01585 [Polyangiaceae bacterium]